jgi:hypothetical protein
MVKGPARLGLVVAMLGACQEPSAKMVGADTVGAPGSRSPDDRGHRVSFEPADLTSAAGGELRVVIDPAERILSRPQLDALAASISLVEWPPSGRSLPVRTTIRQPQAAGPGGASSPQRVYVDVEPMSPIPPGWHFLRVAPLPADFVLGTKAVKVTSDEYAGVRFNVGSAPRVRSVRVCQKEAGYDLVYVEFSEPMVVETGHMTLRVGDRECQLRPTPGGPKSETRFRCETPLFKEGEAMLSFLPGLKAVTGAPVTVDHPTETLTRERFTGRFTGCLLARF